MDGCNSITAVQAGQRFSQDPSTSQPGAKRTRWE